MSETLTLPGFEPMESTESTRSAEASPARTSRSLERVQVLTESEADYGESTPVSLASFDRASCSWRTSGLFAVEDSPAFLETLPRSLTWDRHTLSLLPPLVRLIYGTGSGSSLPTPTAKLGDARRGMPSAETAALRMAQGRRNLDDALALLPTPCAVDGKDGQTGDLYARLANVGRQRRSLMPTPTAGDASSSGSRNTATSKAHPGVSLTDWARGDGGTGRLLPTPQAHDAMTPKTPEQIEAMRARAKPRKGGGPPGINNLNEWAARQATTLLPTPQAQDHRNCADYSDGSRGHSPQLRHLGRGRLNPRFVEWMMNFPEGWTDVPEGSSATR